MDDTLMMLLLVMVFCGVFWVGLILEDNENYEVVGIVKDFTISAGGYGSSSVASVELTDGRKIAVYSRLGSLEKGSTIITDKGMIVKYTVKNN